MAMAERREAPDRRCGAPDAITLGGHGSLGGGRFHRRQPQPAGGEADRRVTQAVVRAKQGDRAALGYLYSRYADCVYGFVASIVRDDDEAEDVVQQVFLKLMSKIDRYEEQETPFFAWLLRVARNVAVDHLRQRREVPVEEVYKSAATPDRPGTEHALSLRDALHALPVEQREVVVLRHFAGLSPGEIALRMGKTESSVHGLHHRGRGALKDELSRSSSAPATTRCQTATADLA